MPRPGDLPFDLDETLRSIVAIRTTVPPDAWSATRLGTERAGSGAVIGSEGLVLTVGYLLTEADAVWVIDESGRALPGHVVGQDTESGFGLVQTLERMDCTPLALGKSGEVAPGDALVVAGFGGIGHTIISRVVTKQEFAGYWEYLIDDAIFTAPAHPQWTGAAAIARDGNLVGIASLILQQFAIDNTPIDANMIIPIDLLKPALPDLIKHGGVNKPPRPWLGVWAAETDGKLVVAGMADNGPAKQAGLQVGDAILAVAGARVGSLADMYRRVWGLGSAGVTVPLKVVRQGHEFDVLVTSADRARRLKRGPLH